MLLWIILIIIYVVIGYGYQGDIKEVNNIFPEKEKRSYLELSYKIFGLLWLPIAIYMGAYSIYIDYKAYHGGTD